jgi:hypothetical protein
MSPYSGSRVCWWKCEGNTFSNGDYLIINEEGKLIGLPINEEAGLWKERLQ